MILFDYKCGHCDHIEEKFVHNKDASPPCSKCGGEMVRLLSVFYPRHTEKVWAIKDPHVVVKRKPNE